MDSGNRGRDVLIGVVVFIIVVLIGVFLIRRRQQAKIINVNSPLPTTASSYQQELQNNFGITVPSNALKADLKDITGGNQMGLATSENTNGKFVYTIIANLEDPAQGYIYEGWLIRGKQGDPDYDTVMLGRLDLAKGGWLVSYTSNKDLSDHKSILVTMERGFASIPGRSVLEGSF